MDPSSFTDGPCINARPILQVQSLEYEISYYPILGLRVSPGIGPGSSPRSLTRDNDLPQLVDFWNEPVCVAAWAD